ncbi:ribosome-inactivating family protein [Spiroplasma eriocheiris]|uniref:Uncharacterized protein n=1 Tax=Spiroplasma eriocheiris TaxID=315358 RepID=A0A0H3XLP2_9MOLU|nr:ribosome-inactivating family protein [Spiroplasma eriocheiris]AKM54484.1 hypothetical protein SERIO_v1c09240 [Spiroplasma eriocheiris]
MKMIIIVIKVPAFLNNKLELIVDPVDLYINGFITTTDVKRYYYFNDARITSLPPSFKAIATNLGYASNYNYLVGSDNFEISNYTISDAIAKLQKVTLNTMFEQEVKKSLAIASLISTESLRFFSVRNAINKILNAEETKHWTADFKQIVTNWDTYSKQYWNSEDDKNAKANITILLRRDLIHPDNKKTNY